MNNKNNNNTDKNKKEKRQKLLIILLIIGMIICIGITIWALFFRDTTPPSDYPPQDVEVNQTPIDNDNSEKIDSSDGGGAINVTYATTATLSLSDKTISFYYANPNASNQNVSILIKVDDLLVAKTDLVTPGHQVNKLQIEKGVEEKLQVGGYKAELTVRAYDPETNEKAMIDTKGEITLTVTE